MRSGELATGVDEAFAPDFGSSGARSQATRATDAITGAMRGAMTVALARVRRSVEARGFDCGAPEVIDRMPFMIPDRSPVAGASRFDHNLSVRDDRTRRANDQLPTGRAAIGGRPPSPDGQSASPDIPGFRPERCASYLAGTEGLPPRPQLLRAIELVRATLSAHAPSRTPLALDIGCGPGREVVALCDAGFAVDAFDPYPEMLERTRATIGAAHLDRVRLALGTLEEHADLLEPNRYDLVHAGFVLPFVRPHAFERCWNALAASLRPGGVFAGQFFGQNDEFIRASSAGEMTAHGTVDVDRLLAGWTVIERDEVDRQGAIGRGTPKWWHVHHVVAAKPA